MIEVKSIPVGNRIRVELGEAVLDLTRAGLYRFEAAAPRMRVYDGEFMEGTLRARSGQEILFSEKITVSSFDRGRPDEFLYWAAWRSYQLAGEAGFDGASNWDYRGLYQESRRHSGFGIEFPVNPGAARLQYLTASTPGLVYYLKGGAMLEGGRGPNQIRVPFRFAPEYSLATQTGDRAEIFLGVGVVGRLDENTTMRMLASAPLDATIRLSQGKALLEVSKAAQDTRIRVAVGESVTELLRPGLYEFDAGANVLQVYGGEASTMLGDRRSRVREGQMLTLMAAPAVKKFDVKQKDSLYEWGYERSLILARSNGVFMTQWERVGRLLRHPQFGAVQRGFGR